MNATARWLGIAFLCVLVPHVLIALLHASGVDTKWEEIAVLPVYRWLGGRDWAAILTYWNFPLWQMPLLVFTFVFGVIIGFVDQRHVWAFGALYATSCVAPFAFDYLTGKHPRMEALWFYANLGQRYLPFPAFVLGASVACLVKGRQIRWRQFSITDVLLIAIPSALAFMTIASYLQSLEYDRTLWLTANGPPITVLVALCAFAIAMRRRATCYNKESETSPECE